MNGTQLFYVGSCIVGGVILDATLPMVLAAAVYGTVFVAGFALFFWVFVARRW